MNEPKTSNDNDAIETEDQSAPQRLVIEVPTELKAGKERVCTCGPTTCCTFGGGCPGPV